MAAFDQKDMARRQPRLTSRRVLGYLSARFAPVRIGVAWLRGKRNALVKTVVLCALAWSLFVFGVERFLQVGDQVASIVGVLLVLGILTVPGVRRLLGLVSLDQSAVGQTAGSTNPTRYLGEAAPRNFVNRDHILSTFNALLDQHFEACRTNGTPSQALVLTVGGMAGVGKTGLALHWAHQVKDRFPDGQFFINLRGYSADGGPVEPHEVLERWLKLLEPDAVLPDTEAALSEMFKNALITKRVLLVVDNASDEAQVRPLLPTVGASAAIVTSREPLTGLAAVEAVASESLDVLAPVDSQRLLTAIIGRPAIDDPDSVASLARYCGHLPLALRVTAGSIVTKSGRGYPLKTLVAAFDVEKFRLSRMRSAPRHAMSDVQLAFSYSYRALDMTARRAFRLLGLHLASGSTIDTYVMGALLGTSAAEAAKVLERLEHSGLVTVVVDESLRTTTPELHHMAYRYRVHDLLRLYAGGLIARRRHRRERSIALRRLTMAYYGCVNHAFNKQNNDNPVVDTEFLEEWRTNSAATASVDLSGSPTDWFDKEKANLLSAVHVAAGARPRPRYTAKLASSMFYFLEIGGHVSDWRAVEQIASDAAAASGDLHDQARSLRNRGRIALVQVLDGQDRLCDNGLRSAVDRTLCREAIALLQRSLFLYRQEYRRHGLRRDRAGEVTVLRELGDAHRLEVDPAAPDPALIANAIEKYDEAGHIYTSLANENGLNSLRLASGIARSLEDPEDHSGKVEALFTTSYRYGATMCNGRAQHGRLAAYSLIRLAALRRRQSRLDEAIELYREAVSMLRLHVSRDHIRRARALALLGQSLADNGALPEATTYLREAVDTFVACGPSHDDEAAAVTTWLASYAPLDESGSV
ncbi:tetratricopeptide repeat protein [Lentzea sp. NPDC054927]